MVYANAMENILAIQAARFGDLVQTRRLLLSLCQKYQTHLCLDKSLAELASMLYPEARLWPLDFHSKQQNSEDNARIFAEMQKERFSQIINCNFSALTGALCRIFDSKKIIGYRPAHSSQGGLLRSAWARIAFRLVGMRAVSPLNLVDFWAWFKDHPIPPVQVNPQAQAGGKGLGIVMAGREQRRSLPLPILASITAMLARIFHPQAIKLFGANSELSLSRKLIRQLPGSAAARIVNLCGKTSLIQLREELTGLDLVITPDTGIMHLAASLGTPTLAFFFSSAWCHETGPYGLGHKIIQVAPACAPCLETKHCQNNLICHKAFEHPAFLRCLSQFITNSAIDDPPPHIQFWQSGLNRLGAAPKLICGLDKASQARQDCANIIQVWLGLSTPKLEPESLYQKLLPYSEWVLPPLRYC